MAQPHVNDLYPPVEIPKRHTPWFIQLMMAFALLVLAAVVYAFWNMGKVPARTLEVPMLDSPGDVPLNRPPQERPQRESPAPSPLTPGPTPAAP